MKVMVMFSKFDIRVSYKIYIIRLKPDWKHSGRLETFRQILAWISSQSTQLRELTSTIRFHHIENFQSSSCKHNWTKRNNMGDLTWTLNPLHVNRALIWTTLAWGFERSGGMIGWFTVEWSWKERGNKTIEFFYSFRDPQLMKKADKYVQIDNTVIPCTERDS